MIYGILSTIAFIIILPFWIAAGIFKPKLLAGFIEKLGFYKNFSTIKFLNRSTVLFYGVSVGEIIALENLIKKTRETFQGINIVVMTGTKTGQETANKKLSGTVNFITYFPFDFPFCIKNMLKKIKPDAIFIMETELWPNFAYMTNKKKLPTYIINARISDRTYKSYKKLKIFFSPILNSYTAIYPQSEHDREKLISIGANPETTKIMGNLKFDIKPPDVSGLNFNKSSKDKIILAGSTHTGEDEIILETFNELKKAIPDLRLIIAPRHPERNEKVFELMQKYAECAKYSKKNSFDQNDLILIDTMGDLGKLYSVCDIAFIGGSFGGNGGKCRGKCRGKGIGGHNPLEAAIFNKPVVSGPSVHNFKDIYAILTSTDAGKIVKTQIELKEYLKKLLTDEKFYQKASKDCEKAFEQNKGALDFVINVLQSIV